MTQSAGMTRLYQPSGLIQIINRTSTIRDARWEYALPCLQFEISHNFASYWGVDYDLEFVGRASATTSPTALKLWLLDNSDLAGALGYHTLGDDGLPFGRVFVLDDIKDGIEITCTLDHELKEMIADPYVNRMVGPDTAGNYYAIEPCDPVEDDRYSHFVSVGKSVVRCSNFVTPLYYGLPNADGSTALDFAHALTRGVPALLPGGYQEYVDPNQAWHSINARLEDGNLSTRSKHRDSRSAMRASRPFDRMAVVQNQVATQA